MAVTVNVADASPLRLPKAMETARVPGTIPRSRNAYPAFLARATATMALSTEAMIFVRKILWLLCVSIGPSIRRQRMQAIRRPQRQAAYVRSITS
jgi:hypothetical protein